MNECLRYEEKQEGEQDFIRRNLLPLVASVDPSISHKPTYVVELVGVGEKAGFVEGAVIHLPFECISFQPSADLRQLLISSAESERRHAVI